MSETYLPEICDSNFSHHQMIEVDKAYYQRHDGKILCGECLEPWYQEQAERILTAVKPWFLSALQYRDNGYLSSDQELSFSRGVPMVDYMRPVLPDMINVYFDMTESNPITFGMIVEYDFNTKFSIDLGDDDEWSTEIEEAFLQKLEQTLRLYIAGSFNRMDSETIEVIIETLGKFYESIAPSAGKDCNCECPDIPEVDGECCICGKGLVRPYYVYYNQAYCVDDMYAIVVKLAIKTNLSEYVGIAQPDEPPLPSNPIPYNDTKEWKMGVIDKYFDYLSRYVGMKPGYRVN